MQRGPKWDGATLDQLPWMQSVEGRKTCTLGMVGGLYESPSRKQRPLVA